MGFLSGRVTFRRFKVHGRSPGIFGPDHLKQLSSHAIGKQRTTSGDGIDAGWSAGDHILDTNFELTKNIINDGLHFALRVDRQKVPADLLRAYTLIELAALAADNPSGHPSARQKREARQSARERLEQEAADGRFLRRQAYPIFWDGQANELLVGTQAATATDRLVTLFQQTFGRTLEVLDAGRQAFLQAQPRQQERSVDDAGPANFVPGISPPAIAWLSVDSSRNFFGNEFLLWLWYTLETQDDTIELADGSEVTAMMARSLTLECPRGQTGRESIQSEAPTRLPEARRAVQAGKMPRKAGLTLVRHDRQYELTIHAETLAISGAKLPEPQAEEDRARLEERVTLLRHLVETLDLLYDAFGQRRTGSDWAKELGRMQKWLR